MHGRATNLGNVVSLLGAFVATAMVMGLLGAGLLIPAVGATGSAATSGVKWSIPLSGASRLTRWSELHVTPSVDVLITKSLDEQPFRKRQSCHTT